MAELLRELPGEPSYVLDHLVERLVRDGWTVTARVACLLQVRRDRRVLTLTLISSAHGTRVHAEGSRDAVSCFRRAIAFESVPPKEFSLTRWRPNFGAVLTAGLGLTVVAGLFLVSAFCQSPPSSDVGPAAVAQRAETTSDVDRLLNRAVSTPVALTATATLPQPTPPRARARAAVPPPPPTPVVSLTPPGAANVSLGGTATPSVPTPAATATIAPARRTPSPVAATPTATPPLWRLKDAYSY